MLKILLEKLEMKKNSILVFFVFLFFSCFSVSTAFAEVITDGSVPSWITGPTNPLVDNMRSLVGKVNNEYFNPPGGTTCCYSVSVALRGTPYGADLEKYGMDVSAPHPGDITDVDILIDKAEELNAWHPIGDGYQPKPGDLAVTIGIWSGAVTASNPRGYYQTGHVVMVTESGGCIYNGNVPGIKEWDLSAEDVYSGMAKDANMKPVAGYIETDSNGAGVISNVIDWGLEMVATIADGLNELIKQFTMVAGQVTAAMSSLGVTLVLLLMIIDFASYVVLNMYDGFSFSAVISKLLKYAFLLFLFMNWGWIINNIFLDFAQSTASAFSGGGNTSSNLTQPQFLLVKGMEALSPGLNFISTAKGLTNIKNWPLLAFLVLISFITIGFLMFSALYVAFIVIEFYLLAAFNAIFMVFPASRFTKFIAEGGLGGLLTATIKLFVAAVLIFMLGNMAAEAQVAMEFPADINELGNGTLRRYIMLCLNIDILVFLIATVPGHIADIYSGNVNLP